MIYRHTTTKWWKFSVHFPLEYPHAKWQIQGNKSIFTRKTDFHSIFPAPSRWSLLTNHHLKPHLKSIFDKLNPDKVYTTYTIKLPPRPVKNWPDLNPAENFGFWTRFFRPNPEINQSRKIRKFLDQTRTRPIDPTIISFILKFLKFFLLDNARNSLYRIT